MSKHNPPPTPPAPPRKSLDSTSPASFFEQHRRTSSESVPTIDAKANLTPYGFGKASVSVAPSSSSKNLAPPSADASSRRAVQPASGGEKRMNENVGPSSAVHRSLSKTGLNKLYEGKRHPAAAALTAAASASSLSLASSTLSSTLSSNGISSIGIVDNPWQTLHVFVLPLFNGEQLGKPIEDLNSLVRQHIQAVISRGFSRAIATIESDIQDLVARGMLTLSMKLDSLNDEKLLTRTIEIWVHFFDQVLPYIEGVFLPAHTDGLLLSLHRPKQNRAQSPTSDSPTTRATSMHHIDVRMLTLRSFRDAVILPVHMRLYDLLMSPKKPFFMDNAEHNQPRLQQMLLVLTSVANHSPTPTNSSRTQQENPEGEAAILQLLRAVRDPSKHNNRTHPSLLHRNPTRISTFISAGKPRDRRGRIARKSVNFGSGMSEQYDKDGVENDDGGETPRNYGSSEAFEREREREILASLRSPNPAFDTPRGSVGGWGLNIEGIGKDMDEDPDEDDIEDADLVDPNFIGLKAGEMVHAQQEGRRRTSTS